MDPIQQAASQIIKGRTVTALTVSIKFCHAMPLSALRDNKLHLQKFGFTRMQARSVDQFNPEMKLLLRFGFKPLTSVTDS